jgi:crossover junction endodeoxyribonuclease RuvC
MKKNTPQKILAIDPGTKHLGVAFFEGRELIYYGVKTIKQMKLASETLKEGKKIVLRMIHDFKPELLVVEKTFFCNNRNSALLNVFADEIQTIGKHQELRVYAYAANTVRKHICGNGSASKDEVARVIVSQYPELKPFLTSDRKWKETFHRNMFDAVALGLFLSTKLNYCEKC